MPSSGSGKKVKWKVGDGAIESETIGGNPVEFETLSDDLGISDAVENLEPPKVDEEVPEISRDLNIEGDVPANHHEDIPREVDTSSGNGNSTNTTSSPVVDDLPAPPEPPVGPPEPPRGEGFEPVEPAPATRNINGGNAPTPGDRFNNEDGGSPRQGEPLDSSRPAGGPPPGPASDPYDDNLGQAGSNAPVRDNGVPNNIPPEMQGEGGPTNPDGELGKKDGLGEGKEDPLQKDKGKGEQGEGDKEGGTSQSKGKNGEGESGTQGGPGGNGYGAVNNGRGRNADPTANARRNLDHQNRSNGTTGSNNSRQSRGASSGGGNPLRNGLNSLKNRLNPFQGLRNRLSKPGLSKGQDQGGNANASGSGDGRSTGSGAGVANLGKKILSFIQRHPYIAGLIIIVIILLLIVLENAVIEPGSNGNRLGTHCTYDLKGVVSTGSVKLDGIEVELINCDGKADDYTVLETIDFEKYVVGVALAEVSWSADNPEYFKSQIIAARGFALKRNASMCPGSGPDTCFYGYNINTQKIRLRACTNDQVYCDIDKPCYHKERSGQPTIYGPEAEGMEGATVWKGQLSEETKAQILAAAEDVKGKVLVDANGEVVFTNFVNTDQQEWHRMALEGKTAEEIMVEYYSDKGATGFSSANCTTMGNIDYGDYVLSSDGHEILHERLDGFLEKNGTSLEAFASLIESNVNKNGYGTRAGVVAAAVTLIGELGNNYGVKIPYYWGGGHYDGVVVGPLGYWGSNECHTYANNQSYDYCGFDCSGFVPWAIKNGGFTIPHMLAGNFQGLSGARRVSLSSSSAVLQPGDLLESEHHIVLVIGIDEENKQYICAEASGNARGVLFTRRSFADSGYWGVQMDGYYETHVRSET